MYLTNLSTGRDTRLFFLKCNNAGLNTVLFLQNWLPNQDSRTQLPYYLPIIKRENMWIHDFPKGIYVKLNLNNLI